MSKKVEKTLNQHLSKARLTLRNQIIDTAYAMFKQKGIKNVTMDEISFSLGISKRTVYELFIDKEELLVSGMLKSWELKKLTFDKLEQQGCDVIDIALAYYKMVLEEHRDVCHEFYADIKKYPKAIELIEKFRSENKAGTRRFVERGIAEGLFNPAMNYELLDNIVSADWKPVLTERFMRQFGFEEVLSNVVMVLLRGISTPEGLLRIDKLYANIKP